ncbi:hypothetical protein A3E39_02600 [Candidatus Uhrbacteria bacterium RIFCSPHIGHO2_12_FULL_60_25]|uniref:Arabinogalactan endo-beta-1,4-galactanase n=1 Tax=Candidatus Uhrbacteria bacterium RIFCSPHIGHO2_12_FULL_60_25 TaxID=1802399 RepID=A0A1F7UKZ1_9BACT|nr:MAG: hypothetical protein A3E39_02600 [Candidatus Uhrbacteria bacterium RIFCSPHIGHO2_12_FULL_60_25]
MRHAILVLAAITMIGAGCAPAPASVARFGVAYSPRGYPSSATDADVRAFFKSVPDLGGIVAFHTNWRDSRDTAGEIPKVTQFAHAAEKEFDIVPAVGFGWTVGDAPDLTSASEPKNNTWTNAETRRKYREMATSYAKTYKPRFMFLGNETNGYRMRATKGEWAAWVSEFKETYDAIKAVSPNTLVFTTFQLERMKGLGRNNGWKNAAQWQALDDFKGITDAIGFTSYPYFEYDAPGDIPADYYTEITKRWQGPVVFTEIGWLAKNSGPYRGNEADQASFVNRFFELTKGLDVRYAVWLFLHDLDKAPTAFDGIGLRAKDGTSRAAEGAWSDVVRKEGR